MSSMVKVLLAVAFSGICTGLSYSQSITFDPGYPKYVNTGFPFYTKKIEILGTFTVPAGYSLVADVQIYVYDWRGELDFTYSGQSPRLIW